MPTNQENMEKTWTERAKELLVGRTIVDVRYMTKDEMNDNYWGSRPVVIKLDTGLEIYPASDDEGNDAGALFTTDFDSPGLPTLR